MTMLKSSLKTPSSIDHDLFPLLTVRSCVSEADESKNGPRFCAEDKMTGAAYEVRSRRLPLERVPPVQQESENACEGNTAAQQQQRQQALSASNVQTIRRQQARIDALLSAVAKGTAPPSVALPIDIYIQEQPSTGDTYVASVDAFAGLSLGDIIRSGWGVMEEQVFLEILNAVESFGYASANLPPHGNLSSDAIKQLLIVRDGASEARQPSRWVVSDWLLLSDDSSAAGAVSDENDFNIESFIGDLEWTLHSSFAQLRISTSAEGAYLAAAQVEEVINETVERIRTYLMQQAAVKAASSATTEDGAQALSSSSATEGGAGKEAVGFAAGKKDANHGVVLDNSLEQRGAEGTKPGALSTSEDVHVDPFSPLKEAKLPTKESTRIRGICNGARQDRGSPRQLSEDNLMNNKSSNVGVATATDSTRNMTLKDKMAYHQAALRNEQLLVNKQRRKNAPLPPRPTPPVNSARRAAAAAAAITPKSSKDDEDVYSDVPPVGLPIQVKPSAYLMQGRRGSASGGTMRDGGNSTSARKLKSPRSARAPHSDGRTPREGSRSTNAATPTSAREGEGAQQQRTQQQQHLPQQPVTPRKMPTTPRDQRERLLDDVVNMAVLSQRRRGQYLRMQQEADRRRREERQQALVQSTPPRLAASELPQHTMPVVPECPGVVVTSAIPSSNASAAAAPPTAMTTAHEQQRGVLDRRSGTILTLNRDKDTVTTTTVTGNMAGTNAVSSASQVGDWPEYLSESPEPNPPSLHARRVVHNYVAPPRPAAAAGPHYRIPLDTPRTRVSGRGAIASGAPLTRPLGPTVGQPFRTGGNAAGRIGSVLEVPVNPRVKRGVNLMRSARGAPAAAVHSTASHVVGKLAGTPGGHPLSARGKKPVAAAVPPVETPVREADTQPQHVQQQRAASSSPHDLPTTPYVKPLQLAKLGLHHVPVSGSADVPAAAGSTRQHGKNSPLGAHSSLSNIFNPPKSAGGSTRPLPPSLSGSPRPGGVGGAAVPGTPRAPNTARPPPPQPSPSPRGYRRVASTGVLQSRTARASNLRTGNRVAAARFQYSTFARTPLSARRGAPVNGCGGAGGATDAGPGKGVVVHSPRTVPRKAVDTEGEKSLAAANCKSMKRLVLERVHVTHSAVAETVQRSPRTAAVTESGIVTPRNRPTSGTVTNNCVNGTKTPGYAKQTASNAARRKSLLRLGNVHPVNETSPGILLRHKRHTTL